MKSPRMKFVAFGVPLCAALSAVTAFAQTTPTVSPEERLAKLEAAATSAQMSGDNAWMLVCSALVLMMTGPGLALFYGGLVRKKNVLATMMQGLAMMAVITLLWAIYGYSMAFAEGNAFFGNLSYLFLRGVGGAPNAAYAERIKFSAMLLFMVLWATIVYFPLAHMVWGKGGFFNAVLGGRVPALDFAGGK